MPFDTIIHSGTIATAADTFACDIGIRDGKIAALGHDLGAAETVIDATDRLVLPGGKVVLGYLDEKGWARVSNIEQGGTCVLTFPRLDTHAWEFIKQASALTGTGK